MADLIHLIIHTDGGSRGNPGPAALGVVIESADGSIKEEYGEYLGKTTNNVAEYSAVVSAMKKAKELVGSAHAKNTWLDFHVDSELLAKHMSGEYRMKNENLKPFFMQIQTMRHEFANVTFKHIYREHNKAADKMVNQALDMATIS